MTHASSRHLRFVSIIFVIIFLFALIPVTTVQAASAQTIDVDFLGACSIQNDLSMVYYCKINTPGNYSNIRLRVESQKFKKDDPDCTWETTVIQDYTYDATNGYYRFVFKGIAASEMSNTLKATLLCDIGNQSYESKTNEYSIQAYVKSLLLRTKNSPKKTDRILCRLAVDMLNYGTAAQIYFQKNLGNLANSILTDGEKDLASKPETSMNSILSVDPIPGATVSFYSVSLTLQNTIDLVTYAKFPGTPADSVYAEVSYTGVKGNTLTSRVNAKDFQKSGGNYRIVFNNITALYFRTPLKVVIKDGNNAISSTLNYSYESYVADTLAGSSDENLKSLVKTMLLYGDSAYAYFTSMNGGGSSANLSEHELHGYVTYADFGAKGDGVADDYDAIVAAHKYANEKNLRVKADDGDVYYIGHMDPKNLSGGEIKTDTDWGDATFIIDDAKMDQIEWDEAAQEYVPVGRNCCLFTVAPSQKMICKYLAPDFKKYLGVDPLLFDYPDWINGVPSSYPSMSDNMLNKTFDRNTTQFTMRDGETFPGKLLLVLRTPSELRWGRHGSANSTGERRPQLEPIVIDKNGKLDELTPLQWDWKEIDFIEISVVDETPLTVSGGTFITIVNKQNNHAYIKRGIAVQRSNVTISGVEHYLQGEEDCFTKDSFAVVSGKEKILPRLGAPYHGFFRLDHCMNVTLKNCVFTNHLRVYSYGNDRDSSAPYDYYAEFCANIILDNCTCAKTPIFTKEYVQAILDKKAYNETYDKEGIMDAMRWGTTGTNFCKNITVQNHCSVSRVDAHKGTYNLTVKDSTLGHMGIQATGWGTMIVENVFAKSESFITLRTDFGAAWYGDIEVTNCTWDIGKNYVPYVIKAVYDPNYLYGFDPVTENGVTYYCCMPTNINIHGFTVDASHCSNKDGGLLLYRSGDPGLQIFSQVISSKTDLDDDYFNDPERYKYPLKVPEQVTLKNLVFIKHPDFRDTPRVTYDVDVTLRNAEYPNVTDEHLFDPTTFNYNPEEDITYVVADS